MPPLPPVYVPLTFEIVHIGELGEQAVAERFRTNIVHRKKYLLSLAPTRTYRCHFAVQRRKRRFGSLEQFARACGGAFFLQLVDSADLAFQFGFGRLVVIRTVH